MKVLSPHEWAILDALEVGGVPLEIFFADEQAYVDMLNVPWHGLDTAACHRALANLADAALIETVKIRPIRLAVAFTLLGSKNWAERFVIDLDRYIGGDVTWPTGDSEVASFVCTSRCHLQLFHDAVREIIDGHDIQLGNVEEAGGWEPYSHYLAEEAFEFQVTTSSRECMTGSPVSHEISRTNWKFCEGWRKPHLRFHC